LRVLVRGAFDGRVGVDGPIIPHARNGVVIRCAILANTPRCFVPRRSYYVYVARPSGVKFNYRDRRKKKDMHLVCDSP